MFAIGERVPGIAYLLKCKNISYHDVPHVAKNLERVLQSEYFRCLQNIREMENARSHTECDNLHILGKYSRTFDMSFNLSNPAHLDNGDVSNGVSLWLRKKSSRVTTKNENWWFVLPNLTMDNKCRGVAIQLSNGLAIEWDGRKIKHCTAIPSVPNDDSFVGAFFSAKKKFTK
jgi:hypothetical protein